MHLIFILIFLLYEVETGNYVRTTSKYPCDEKILFVLENSANTEDSAFQKQLNFLVNYTFEKWNHFDHLAVSRYGDKLYEQVISFDNSLAVIPLSPKFDSAALELYLKQATIIRWNITDSETPDRWEEQFNDFYNCGDQQATIMPTDEPIIPYPSCEGVVTFAFDKSNGFTETEYKQMQDFLINYVFKNWTRLDQLNLYSFADHVYSSIQQFESTTELADFIQKEERIPVDSDFCNFLHMVFDYYEKQSEPMIIFLGSINEQDFERQMDSKSSCQEFLKHYVTYPPTFVLLNEKVSIDMLRQHIPQAQIIKLNLPEIPTNWEWRFLTTYGSNEDDYNDTTSHPCNKKFIFAYEMNKQVLKDFLINEVFGSDWRVFQNIAFLAYSNKTVIQDFGTLTKLEDVHNFIDESFNQNSTSSTSLCQVFKELTTMHLWDVNIILFVNEFHQFETDECPTWIKQLRDNINFINFIVLSKQVNTEYLASKFPQARFTYWDTTKSEVPNNWDAKLSFGCQDFVVTTEMYPCPISCDNIIIYDRSNSLSPFEYQKLTYFLLSKLFIKEWTYAMPDIHIYPNKDQAHMLDGWTALEFFIRRNLRVEMDPFLCPTLNDIKDNSYGSNFLFFVGKFDENVVVLNKTCNESAQKINEEANRITFIKLKRFNETFLKQTFTNAVVVEWNVEEEDEPANWNEMLWKAFGCSDKSPIVFPRSTSIAPTVKQATKELKTTVKGSNLLSSTEYVQTPLKTTSLFTTTTKFNADFSNTPNKQKENSKEATVLLVTFIPLFVISLLIGVGFFYFYRHKQREQLIDNMVFSNLNKLYANFNKKRENDLWEIDIEYVNINFIDRLGSGEFCDVFNGKLLIESPAKEIHNDSRYQRFYNCDVAVKTLPAMMQSDKWAIKEFQKELDLMKSLKFHQNVVCFLGFVNNCENPLMLLEYCSNGDLLQFIKANRQKIAENFESQDTTNCKSLLSFAWQVSNGLDYLGSLNLIHRDVALRNVLLDNNNICKICDFGLSCLNSPTQTTSQAAGRKFPLKWMAIESIKENIFSTKTDVWSYGILLWKLFTLGDSPYNDVKSVLSHLESGQRLNKPDYCTDEIYGLMTSCWSIDPNERPTFTEICKLLAKKIEAATKTKYNYVDAIESVEDDVDFESIGGMEMLETVE